MNKSPEVIICFTFLEKLGKVEKRVNELENEFRTCNAKVEIAKAALIDSFTEHEYGKSHIVEFDHYYFVMLYDTGNYIAQIVEK